MFCWMLYTWKHFVFRTNANNWSTEIFISWLSLSRPFWKFNYITRIGIFFSLACSDLWFWLGFVAFVLDKNSYMEHVGTKRWNMWFYAVSEIVPLHSAKLCTSCPLANLSYLCQFRYFLGEILGPPNEKFCSTWKSNVSHKQKRSDR